MQKHEVLADGLLFPEGPVAQADGSVLVVEIERRTVTRVFAGGGKEIAAELDGGPNGMAVGPEGALYICNNGGFLFGTIDGFKRTVPGVPAGYAGGWIERLDLESGRRDILYESCGEHRLVGPNDLVFDANGGFYFTDYGKFYPRFRMNGGLYYAHADGSSIVEVAYPLITPNGAGLSLDGSVVYVAETETGRLWAFDLDAPGVARKYAGGAPHGGRIVCTMPRYQRFDSLALDANGNIAIATLVSGCITTVTPAGEVVSQVETGDPVTTNICFGGPDLRTAYVTLSGKGQLVKFDWPVAGASLK